MSAIWGIIDFHGAPAPEMAERLSGAYQCYRIDRYERLSGAGAEFGCCHQYLTREAVNEHLPVYDKERNLLFTADCVLDNRDELLALLPECGEDPSDGQLLLAAYLKWGGTLGDYCLGAFAFAAFHTDTRTVALGTDHMGNRSLFYSRQGNLFIFSTAVLPLAKLCQAVPSEQWLSGCLFSTSADMTLFKGLTPYQDIFQMPAACMMTVTNSRMGQTIYWSPLKLRPDLRQSCEEACQKLFVETLSTSVCSMLRSSQKTGCALSSGLNSSSIAALAAAVLAAQGKSLYSYTSVPLPDFPKNGVPGEITDETPGVKALCAKYSNIIPHFLPCWGRDAFSELPSLLPLIGYPMKYGLDLIWLSEIYRHASVEGCRLMLQGQYGNYTISYGTAPGTLHQLLASLHPFKAARLNKSYSARYGVPKIKISHFLFVRRKKKPSPDADDMSGPLTAPELIQKYRLGTVMVKKQKRYGNGQTDTRRQRLNLIVNPFNQMQLGMFDTVMGLIYGVLIRDPAKDKRVVELCCRLPVKCMLAGGVEQGLVRTYMKGLVPDEILDDLHHQGVQSADYCYRSRLQWRNYRAKVLAALELPELQKYVDSARLSRLLDRLHNTTAEKLPEADLRQANVLYSCSLFLQLFQADTTQQTDETSSL